MPRLWLVALAALAAARPAAGAPPVLVGFASLPAATFNPGPTSGRFHDGANGVSTPFENRQPVQGVSAILAGPGGRFLAVSDNGFGSAANSADALLAVHELDIMFRTPEGGSGAVELGRSHALSDPRGAAPFPIVAERAFYPNGDGDVPVDPAIAAGRLLTGADFDIESARRDANGDYWFGDEFGPFLLRTGPDFALEAVVPTPGVVSPDNPLRGDREPNLRRSGGYEGLAISPDGATLYAMLEGAVTGDPAGALRIETFDVARGAFTGERRLYPLDPRAAAIGDLTRVSDRVMVVIERDARQGRDARFKRLFLVDLDVVGADGMLRKREIADLLAIDDRHDLDRDGSSLFAFPFATIESVAPVDGRTLLVANDDNFPFTSAREPGAPDDTEFILLRFDRPLVELAPR